MAVDVFDLSELKKHAPKYLDLGSVKDALLTSVNSDDTQMEELPTQDDPVHMEVDTIVTPEVVIPEVVIPEVAKSNSSNNLEERDHNEDNEAKIHSESSRISHLMSPTKSGAQLALRNPDSNSEKGYSYEVSMPVPAPWHENLPYIISTYLQLAFNAFVLCFIGWLLYVLNEDVSRKIEERTDKLILDAAWCKSEFIANKCHEDSPPRFLVENKDCLRLQQCKDMDPTNVRRISMYASLVSEILNELVQPLQWQTVLTSASALIMAGVCIFFINYIFGFLRAKTYFSHEKTVNLASHRTTDPRSDKSHIRIRAIAPQSGNIWKD